METETIPASPSAVKFVDYRDLTIEAFADENATLHEAKRQLIDLIVDLADENARLRILYKRELFVRIQGDKLIACLQRTVDHFKTSSDRTVSYEEEQEVRTRGRDDVRGAADTTGRMYRGAAARPAHARRPPSRQGVVHAADGHPAA